jgi:hypothetical protein
LDKVIITPKNRFHFSTYNVISKKELKQNKKKFIPFLFKFPSVLDKVIQHYRILGVVPAAGAAAQPKPPGVLLIISDRVFDHFYVGFYGLK